MKPDIVRKNASSSWTEFEFAREQRFFFVKNLSSEPCFVAFEANPTEAEAIKVLAGTGEEVAVSYADLYDSRALRQKKLWIKGNGEIEVQGMESWVE